MFGEILKARKHNAFIHTTASSSIGKMLTKFAACNNFKCINIVRNYKDFESMAKTSDFTLVSCDPKFETSLKYMCDNLKPSCAFDPIGGSFAGKIITNLSKNGELYLYDNLSSELISDVSSDEFIDNEKKIKGL